MFAPERIDRGLCYCILSYNCRGSPSSIRFVVSLYWFRLCSASRESLAPRESCTHRRKTKINTLHLYIMHLPLLSVEISFSGFLSICKAALCDETMTTECVAHTRSPYLLLNSFEAAKFRLLK